MKSIKDLQLSNDDPLKNIYLMAPYLDEAGQNRVFGMICGLVRSGEPEKPKRKQRVKELQEV